MGCRCPRRDQKAEPHGRFGGNQKHVASHHSTGNQLPVVLHPDARYDPGAFGPVPVWSREKLPPALALLTEAYTVASLSKNKKNGTFSIQFYTADKKRVTVRIGKVSDRNAEAICRHVEYLNTAHQTGQQPPKETLAWLAGVGPVLRERLAKAGLVEADRRLTFGAFLAGWLDGKKAAGFKPTSMIAWGQTVTALTILLGDKRLDALTHADGERFRDHMRDKPYRATTVHKRLTHAKGMIEDAMRLGHLDKNPFKHVKTRQGDPSERRAYVRVGDIQRVIDHMPNVWWRLLVALARYAGLRVPSEPFALTWGDVDWERERLTVPSPKTEGQGKPHRIIPLFPLLKPHLEAAFDTAAEGDVFIFPEDFRRRATGERGLNGCNLRTTFGKCIRKAGVEAWPRIWHSLRASCESDLAQSFPLAVVAKWLGNTPSVALRHYVDPTDTAFDAAKSWQPGAVKSAADALRKALRSGTDGECLTPTDPSETPEKQGGRHSLSLSVSTLHKGTLEAAGIEPASRGNNLSASTCVACLGSGHTLRLPRVRSPRPQHAESRSRYRSGV